ncbi:MAG: polyphosphate kinase 1 [Cyanobacteria bacterium Co-bin13]|nr:polyphosphate kinase 1 [Cyanobacteria bacterium Co-bin13]
MATVEPTTNFQNLRSPEFFISRELSWLEFNRRVLHEALDDRTPLLERLKFLGIFSSNLDEFFMVRVAGIKQQIAAQVSKRTPDGRSPAEHLEAICQMLRPMVTQQHEFFEQTLRSQLSRHGVCLLDYADLKAKPQDYLKTYFEEQIFPVLTPLAVDPGHPFPYISNLSLSLAVVVRDHQTKEEHFARVKVPKVLPRFVTLPSSLFEDRENCHWIGVPLEQVIAHNLHFLFPGMDIQAHYPFRVTRNADLAVEEDEADDLMSAIEQELRRRRLGGSAVRIEIHAQTPPPVRAMLVEELGLTETDVYDIEGLLCLGDLMTFLSLPLPDLKDPPWSPVIPAALDILSHNPDDDEADYAEDMFALLRRQDQLIHHPYHSFSGTVQCFITHAAHDPHVLAIKMTLYRTSGDSPIVNALISAAENGKQVVVLVELKARFDEENNINWARKLENSGVHVVYGLVGLKTHTKVTLVVRREAGQIRRYCHIGTGNYNPKTARLYTDLGLFSGCEELGADLSDLFNYLTGYSRQSSYRKLMIAPVNLRQRIIDLIRGEMDQASQGKPARIVAKMNSLVDPTIIAALYEASQAGVKIDLIIRGICCLRPGLEGVSDNIRVISIIGRFLEHSRIFFFQNAGPEAMLLGSADWMPRNLDRRIEAVVPVEDEQIRAELRQILEISLADNRHAWDMQPDGSYIQRRPRRGQRQRSSQGIFMERALKSAE